MKRLTRVIIVLALVAVACGDASNSTATTVSVPPVTSPPATTPPTTTPPTTRPPTTLPPFDPSARILEVRLEGGLVPPETILSRMPMYTLFGDGRLVYEGPYPAIWPGPLLPALVQVDVGDEGLASVLADLNAVGLPRMVELYNYDAISQVADGPNTVVTYFDDAGEHVFSVYALRIADQKDPRVLLLADLVNRLDQLAAQAPSTGPFQIERLQVLAASQGAFPDHDLAVIQPWPLSMTPDEMKELDFAVLCVVIAVPEEPATFRAFQDAHQLTFFEYDEVPYRFTVRPLLTGESGCVPLDR